MIHRPAPFIHRVDGDARKEWKTMAMSERFEGGRTVDVPLAFVPAGTQLGVHQIDDAHVGLVIGDPSASAYVVEGTMEELYGFTERLQELVRIHCDGTEPPLARSLRLMAEQFALTEDDLAEHVLDSHCASACAITNSGLDAQIRYLLTVLSPAEVEAALRDLSASEQ